MKQQVKAVKGPAPAPPAQNSLRRIGLVHAALAIFGLAVLGQAMRVQVVQGSRWKDDAHRQHFSATEVQAPRGLILDATGATLASTREMVRIAVAPPEVRDMAKLRRALQNAKVDAAVVQRATDVHRKWVELPRAFVAENVAALTAMRGVHTTPISDRSYSVSPGLRSVVGHVANGEAVGGIEQALDSLLRGTDGAAQVIRDVNGRRFASPTEPGTAPEPGHQLTLTINHELQQIAERTLSAAVAKANAEGGDIVILEPRTGKLLALAGERRGIGPASATVLTEPFEPGSTVKPLIAAGLITRGRARVTDMVPTRGGSYELHGRIITDEPHEGPTPSRLSLADVIRYSNNVGIVQFAERLSPREEFETLRDFGLGTATGLPFPSEASGTLRPPSAWSKQSAASLAMGYELNVTPLQLAMAYGAIANGGELLEPALIQEIRDADGDVVFRHERRVVRRVLTEQQARTMRTMLSDVVDRGTAVDAGLATFRLAGKTGTPRRVVDGSYAPRQYNPNFVGLFPADEPMLVIVVKLVNPQGNFYGGHTAAPMTKTIIEAALAARDAALDPDELRASRSHAGPVQSGSPRATVAAATAAPVSSAASRARTDTVVRSARFQLPPAPKIAPSPRAPRAIPKVRGLNVRDAVRSLHDAGFRVQLLRGASSQNITEPPPGAIAAAGTLVRLRYGR